MCSIKDILGFPTISHVFVWPLLAQKRQEITKKVKVKDITVFFHVISGGFRFLDSVKIFIQLGFELAAYWCVCSSRQIMLKQMKPLDLNLDPSGG